MMLSVRMLMLVSVVGFAVVQGYPAQQAITFSPVRSTPKTPIDPNHVPSSACENMMPVHGNSQPSADLPPYEIKLSANTVRAGEKIKVTVSGIEDNEYLGLYIQGRINNKPVGQFVLSDNPLVHVSNCPPGEKNAASYISNIHAVKELSLDWIAPNDAGSEVVFRATIVKTFSQFWVGVVSDKVTIKA